VLGGLAEDFDGISEEIDVEAAEGLAAARAGVVREVLEGAGSEHGVGKRGRLGDGETRREGGR
jgi:hypothetical protein